jgi:cephalosporin hydroxylase
MRKFWDPVVKPMLEALSARRIVEIGAANGDHTVRLARWCRRHGAHLDVIDPLPHFDVGAFSSDFDGHVRVHTGLSLDILADLLPADLVLIDGDHNWYTVFHEIQSLYGVDGAVPASAPVAICHDVSWPYGRRDLYYDPDTVPAAYRQPMARGGLAPDDPGLLPGGLNSDSYHALTEGGPRNGVRTGITDALAGRRDQFRIVWLEVMFGLGIIVPVARLAAHSDLSALLDRLEPSPNWKTLAMLTEQERVSGAIARHQLAGIGGTISADESGVRSFASSLPADVVANIQGGVVGYRYKGRRMMLHPLDIANYLAVLGSLRPATLFEIGTLEGGRALWLADMAKALDIDMQVIAVDVRPPADLDAPGLRFLTGDARKLTDVFDEVKMASLPRPFLVIEDSAHDETTCLAVLDFFDPYLASGDMIVVEDGSVGALVPSVSTLSGPSAAIARFLAARGDDYAIDAESCDRFGYNATSNPNGWLRRR